VSSKVDYVVIGSGSAACTLTAGLEAAAVGD